MEHNSLRKNLTDHLSAGKVNFEEDVLESYGSSFSGLKIRPVCITYPEQEEDIKKILKFAAENKLQCFPLSRGKNFGYGTAQGTKEGQIIIDLSRMNKILEVNQELCYVKLQPGVSQKQLYDYLTSLQNNRLQLDVTGAGLHASIVGNILERGFGHTDYGDRFSRIINMKIMLADGSIIQTGFGGFGNANALNTFRYGIGPLIDGIFTQSNLGVIIEMTLELMPRQEKNLMFVFSTKKYDDIGKLVTAVRELKLNGVINSTVHIANKARAIGQSNLSMIGVWNMSGVITGPREVVLAKRDIIKKTFRKYLTNYNLYFMGAGILKKIGWINDKLMALPLYGTLRDAYDLQCGIPTDQPLKVLFNNPLANSETLSPAEYDLNFKWICSVCRADAYSVTEMLETIHNLFDENKYEFRVTLTAINARSFIMISNIVFEKNEEERKRASAFYKLCTSKLNEKGYFPYRSGSGSYDSMPEQDFNALQFLKKLKKAADPENILAPGKYNI
jgi:4-cresol dehydrogenase (hydroxylating) flavoprotein subunit